VGARAVGRGRELVQAGKVTKHEVDSENAEKVKTTATSGT